MVGGRDSTIIFYAACVIFGIVFGFVVMDWYFDAADLCDAQETTGACVREWLGAWSGYVAALAAGITLLALYDQIREQRKQTEFMIGDANPSVDVMAEDFTYAYVQIVNWNRRTFLIDSIVPADKHSLFADLEEIEIDESKYPVPHDWAGAFEESQRVAGWIDRTKAPMTARFKVQVFFTKSGSGRKPRREEVTIQVIGRLVGEEHKPLTLPAKSVIHSY